MTTVPTGNVNDLVIHSQDVQAAVNALWRSGAEALAIKGAHLFDPSGQNRPMKEWVAVPVAQSKEWPGLARAAYDYAESLTK